MAQPQVSSPYFCSSNKDLVKTCLCSPFQTSARSKGYGWFDFYLSTAVERQAEKLVSGPVGWQLPGWCYRLVGLEGFAGARPHNHCNYLWGGKKGNVCTCDRHALINRRDLHPFLAFAARLTTFLCQDLRSQTFWSPQCLICKFNAAVVLENDFTSGSSDPGEESVCCKNSFLG